MSISLRSSGSSSLTLSNVHPDKTTTVLFNKQRATPASEFFLSAAAKTQRAKIDLSELFKRRISILLAKDDKALQKIDLIFLDVFLLSTYQIDLSTDFYYHFFYGNKDDSQKDPIQKQIHSFVENFFKLPLGLQPIILATIKTLPLNNDLAFHQEKLFSIIFKLINTYDCYSRFNYSDNQSDKDVELVLPLKNIMTRDYQRFQEILALFQKNIDGQSFLHILTDLEICLETSKRSTLKILNLLLDKRQRYIPGSLPKMCELLNSKNCSPEFISKIPTFDRRCSFESYLNILKILVEKEESFALVFLKNEVIFCLSRFPTCLHELLINVAIHHPNNIVQILKVLYQLFEQTYNVEEINIDEKDITTSLESFNTFVTFLNTSPHILKEVLYDICIVSWKFNSKIEQLPSLDFINKVLDNTNNYKKNTFSNFIKLLIQLNLDNYSVSDFFKNNQNMSFDNFDCLALIEDLLKSKAFDNRNDLYLLYSNLKMHNIPMSEFTKFYALFDFCDFTKKEAFIEVAFTIYEQLKHNNSDLYDTFKNILKEIESIENIDFLKELVFYSLKITNELHFLIFTLKLLKNAPSDRLKYIAYTFLHFCNTPYLNPNSFQMRQYLQILFFQFKFVGLKIPARKVHDILGLETIYSFYNILTDDILNILSLIPASSNNVSLHKIFSLSQTLPFSCADFFRSLFEHLKPELKTLPLVLEICDLLIKRVSKTSINKRNEYTFDKNFVRIFAECLNHMYEDVSLANELPVIKLHTFFSIADFVKSNSKIVQHLPFIFEVYQLLRHDQKNKYNLTTLINSLKYFTFSDTKYKHDIILKTLNSTDLNKRTLHFLLEQLRMLM